MRRSLAILSALAASIIPALAQTGMPDAIIENYDISFDMNSPESMQHYRAHAYNEKRRGTGR